MIIGCTVLLWRTQCKVTFITEFFSILACPQTFFVFFSALFSKIRHRATRAHEIEREVRIKNKEQSSLLSQRFQSKKGYVSSSLSSSQGRKSSYSFKVVVFCYANRNWRGIRLEAITSASVLWSKLHIKVVDMMLTGLSPFSQFYLLFLGNAKFSCSKRSL